MGGPRSPALTGTWLSAALLTLSLCVGAVPVAAQNPVVFDVRGTLSASQDSLMAGNYGRIQFMVDANGNEVAGLIFGLEVAFSDRNIIGPLSDTNGRIDATLDAKFAFEHFVWHREYGLGNNPDTILYEFYDTDSSYWTYSSRGVWWIGFVPDDTGRVQFDTIFGLGSPPTTVSLTALDPDSNPLPVIWLGGGKEIVVFTPEPAVFDLQTTLGNDSLIMGVPGGIVFSVNANGHRISGLAFPFEINFSGSNIIGMLSQPGNVVPSEAALTAFESSHFNPSWLDGMGTDSAQYLFTDLGGDAWEGNGEVWRIDVEPLDTGTIRFDSILLPPANQLNAWNDNAQVLPKVWLGDGLEITVYIPTGDVNGTGTITAADIVYLVGFVFKSQPAPLPCEACGDADCSGEVTASDIIYLVNHALKSGPPPCDINTLIPGTWSCP
jgi:hypothetical protein